MNFQTNTCLFDKSPAQCRSIGSRGGRTSARNRRMRQRCQPTPKETPAPAQETAHEASAMLDAAYPWLVGAFANKRRVKRAA